LIELLAVIAIIAVMSGLVGYLLRGSGTESRGLQTAQSTVASLLTLARSQAAVSGQNAAFFVHADLAEPERFYRYIAAAVWDPTVGTSGAWRAVGEGVTLPAGCFVIPRNGPSADMVEVGANWGGADEVKSTALRLEPPTQSLFLGSSATWVGTSFTPRGTTGETGDIVVASGRLNAPGASKPFVYTNPDNVRGVSVSQYGQLTMLNNRRDL
jgi:type II secretory pathway pseudopilin PulG